MKKLKTHGLMKSLKNKKLILLIPILLFNILFVIGGIFKGIVDSFGNEFYNNGWIMNNKFILFNNEIIDSIIFTFKISTISAIISLIIALFILYIIYQNSNIKNFIKRFLFLPVLTPYLLIAFFMMYTFSTSGFFNRILFELGFFNELSSAPIYINDKNGIGIILSYVWKAAPFLSIVLLSNFESFDEKLIQVSTSLGAKRSRTFFKIILPHLKNTIIYSTLIIFTFIFSSIEIPLILGPTRPQTISLWAYQNFQNGDFVNRSFSLAINSFILLINIFVVTTFGSKLYGEIHNEKNN